MQTLSKTQKEGRSGFIAVHHSYIVLEDSNMAFMVQAFFYELQIRGRIWVEDGTVFQMIGKKKSGM